MWCARRNMELRDQALCGCGRSGPSEGFSPVISLFPVARLLPLLTRDQSMRASDLNAFISSPAFQTRLALSLVESRRVSHLSSKSNDASLKTVHFCHSSRQCGDFWIGSVVRVRVYACTCVCVCMRVRACVSVVPAADSAGADLAKKPSADRPSAWTFI